MKELLLTSANLYLVPSKPPADGPMLPMVELILVTSEPRYASDEVGAMVRSRMAETMRVHVSPEGARQVAKQLSDMANAADAMAKRVAAPAAVVAAAVEKAKTERAERTRPRSNKLEAVIEKTINGHILIGKKWSGKWQIACVSFPELAKRFHGCADASGCLDEFERLATAGGTSKTGTEERKECVE